MNGACAGKETLADFSKDTSFNETLAKDTDDENESALETAQQTDQKRARAMTEKGREYSHAVAEKSARHANKAFNDILRKFHAFMVRSRDHIAIAREYKDVTSLANHADDKLRIWLEFAEHSPHAEFIRDLQDEIKTSVEGAREAMREKLRLLDEEEISSIRSHTSSRSMSRRSIASTSSSQETLISVKAKRAALQQRIKFSDAIQEQQKVLNKLQLQQELSEMMAKEAVYTEALQDEPPPNLPLELEHMVDRYMLQSGDNCHVDATGSTQPHDAHSNAEATGFTQPRGTLGNNIAYREARKKLKQRFGRPTLIAADFETKLANWPKIARCFETKLANWPKIARCNDVHSEILYKAER